MIFGAVAKLRTSLSTLLRRVASVWLGTSRPPRPRAWCIATCPVGLASWLLGTYPSVTSIDALVRKMALTWWVGRSVFFYHMLEIVRGCSRQDWLLLVPGNRPLPQPAKKNTNKNFKRTNFRISDSLLRSCVTSYAERRIMDIFLA